MITDFLSSLNNAILARNEYLEVPYSSLAENIAELLKRKNMIQGFKVFKFPQSSFKGLRINLRYEDGESFLRNVKIVSRPGLRNYLRAKEIPFIRKGSKMVVVSTSQGVLDDYEAVKRSLGGEILCKIY